LTLQVNKVVPVITVQDIPDKTPSDTPFTILCSSNSDGTYTFSSSDSNVATVNSNGVVTIQGPGYVVLTVSQAASPDGVYAAAVPVSEPFTVLETSLLTLASNNVTIQYTDASGNVPTSSALFIEANPRGTGNEWFAVVKNGMKTAITNYAKGTNNTPFERIPGDNSTLVPFNNIVTTLMTNMSYMFYDAASFNYDISSWDTSNVENMNGMFHSASAFNKPLDSWNVSSVERMDSMFSSATSFNQSLNSWITSVVENMSGMFTNALAFNQPLDTWNTSLVTNMSSVFYDAIKFNQPLDSWNVSSVQYMSSMFQNAAKFDQPLNAWNVSSVQYMDYMFTDASLFNQPLNLWNVSSVLDMNYMFQNATLFNQDISGWVVDNVTPKPPTDFSTGSALTVANSPVWFPVVLDSNQVTYKFVGSIPAGSENPFFVTDANNVVYAVMRNSQDSINKINAYAKGDSGASDPFTHSTAGVIPFNRIVTTLMTNMVGMFNGATTFNSDINSWDVSGVITMNGMFINAEEFNQPLYSWNVSSVLNMNNMFKNATLFNQDISGWDVSNVTPKPPTDFRTGSSLTVQNIHPTFR
jgi:surface protein